MTISIYYLLILGDNWHQVVPHSSQFMVSLATDRNKPFMISEIVVVWSNSCYRHRQQTSISTIWIYFAVIDFVHALLVSWCQQYWRPILYHSHLLKEMHFTKIRFFTVSHVGISMLVLCSPYADIQYNFLGNEPVLATNYSPGSNKWCIGIPDKIAFHKSRLLLHVQLHIYCSQIVF